MTSDDRESAKATRSLTAVVILIAIIVLVWQLAQRRSEPSIQLPTITLPPLRITPAQENPYKPGQPLENK